MATWVRTWASGWVQALPIAVVLAFAPWVAAPFSAPKTFVLVFSASVLGGWFLASNDVLDGWVGPQRSFWCAVLVFLLATSASATLSSWRYMCASSVVWFVSGFLLLWSVRLSLHSNLQRLLLAIGAAVVVVALLTIAQFLSAWDLFTIFGQHSGVSGRMRMYATIGNPAFVGALLGTSLPAVVACGFVFRGRWLLSAISAAVAVGAIVLTGSRTGLFAAAVSVVIMAALLLKRPLRAVLCAAFAVAFTAGIVLSPWNPREITEAARGRLLIWEVAMEGQGARHFLGDGPGTFAYLYPAKLGRFLSSPDRTDLIRYAGHERHAENDFVEVYHDSGFVGLLALVTVFGTWLYTARRIWRSDRSDPAIAASIAGVVSTLSAAMFDFPLHRPETWTLLMLWMAVPLAYEAKSGSSAPTSAVRSKVLLASGVALGILGLTLAAPPVISDYLLARGERFENRGELGRAIASYRSAIRWYSPSTDAQFNLTRALAKHGRLEDALKQSAEAARYVNEPELWLLRARILSAIGLPDVASRELRTKSAAFPYSKELRDESQGMASSATGK